MDVRITGRHGDSPDELKDYAREKVAPLGRFNRHAQSVEVILDEDHLSKTVEMIAHLDRGAPIVVHAKHEEARAAVDLAHHKLERALRRQKERREDRRHAGGPPPPASTGTAASADARGEEE